MRVELRSSFAGLVEAWEALRAVSPADHVFLSFAWQTTWWSIFGPPDALHLILVWDGDDLAAAAPLYRDGKALRFVGGVDLTDYLDCLYRPDAAPSLFEVLRHHLAEAGALSLDLTNLPDGSPTLPALTGFGQEGAFRVWLDQADVCPAIDLEGGWDGYLARLTKKDRHELRRKSRRLESAGAVRHYLVDSLPAIRAAWPDFFRLHTLSRPEKVAFLTPDVRRFFEEMAEALFPLGIFRLYFLEVDGIRVSAVICFVQGDELWLYNSGYDPDYRHLSVGLLLKALCLRDAAEAGLRRFDFLRGSEPYKYHLGATDRPIYRVRVERG